MELRHFEVAQLWFRTEAGFREGTNDSWTPLHNASHHGDLQTVQYLISRGVDLEEVDDDGWTPLHFASSNGHLDVVQLLIGKGADVGKRDENGITSLHMASYNGHLEVVQYLACEGADLERADYDGRTPLYLASDNGHLGVVQYLTGKGADLDKADNDGSTPLHTASYNGHLKVVQHLAGEGADLEKADNNGSTPLHQASQRGHLEVVRYLTRKGADLEKANDDGSTPLHEASYNGHLEVVQYLTSEGADLHKGNMIDSTPLHKASFNGHLDVVQYLVSKGADLEKRDNNGCTSLHNALLNGHLDVVQYLFLQGPLSLASDQGHIDVIHYLCYKQQQNDNDQGRGSRKESGGTDEQVDEKLNEQLAKPKDVKEHLQQHDVDSAPDQKTIDERISLGAGASINESSQRVIRLEKYQIEVQVHPSEPLGVEDITVRAITEVPPQLLDVLQENEAVICVGLEMTQSDANFSTPVKVTMPHSAIFTRLHTVSIGTYYRKSKSDSFSLITFAHGDPRCVVRERDLDLYIDHFSEWWIIAFITRTFFGKRVTCTPFVPESNPRNAEHRVRLCIRDNNTGKAEPEPGYLAPVKGEEYFIAWRSGELRVTCIADNKDFGTKIRKENVFHKSIEVNIPFLVNTASTDKPRVFLQFILEQNAMIDIICPISFKDLEDGCLQGCSCSDLPRSQPAQEKSQTPETLGRTDSSGGSRDEMSLSRQTLSDPTTGVDGTQSPVGSQEVTDVHLLSLSRELLPGHFSALYVALGIPAGTAESIRVEKMNNYPETYMQLLQLWKAESKRTLADLDQVLVKAKVKGLRSKYKL